MYSTVVGLFALATMLNFLQRPRPIAVLESVLALVFLPMAFFSTEMVGYHCMIETHTFPSLSNARRSSVKQSVCIGSGSSRTKKMNVSTCVPLHRSQSTDTINEALIIQFATCEDVPFTQRIVFSHALTS